MIGGIIVTHASFAQGVKEAVEMIAGHQEELEAVTLQEGDGIESLLTRIKEVRETMKSEHVYLFVDLFGATPCNVCSLLCSEGGYDVIAGVNLPLLLDFVIKREGTPKDILRKELEETSKHDFYWLTQQDICEVK